jgi:hypothetical protein
MVQLALNKSLAEKIKPFNYARTQFRSGKIKRDRKRKRDYDPDFNPIQRRKIAAKQKVRRWLDFMTDDWVTVPDHAPRFCCCCLYRQCPGNRDAKQIKLWLDKMHWSKQELGFIFVFGLHY